MTNLSDLLPAGAASKQLSFTADGAIASGQTVALQSNGTIKAISSTAAGFGSEVVFESANSELNAITYDTTNDKVVIAYRDAGNSDYGTAVVGTVSGTTISFGTPVVFESASTLEIGIGFDSTNGKVVIAYKDQGNSNYGTAIVGTVSGTSISFGSAVVFETSSTVYTSVVFDSTNEKIVIAYADAGDGDKGKAVVGTVSGTSISFGSIATYANAHTVYAKAIYDSNAGKIVIAYRDQANSKYGTAIVGTVSGTSISFGSEAVFESAESNHISLAYDSSANKVVIVYADGGNSDYITSVIATVSGTSVSFGTPVVVSNAAVTNPIGVAYNTDSNKTFVTYQDGSNSNYGAYAIGTVSGTSISFTSSAYWAEVNSISNQAAVYDPDQKKVVIAFRDGGNSNYGTSIVYRDLTTNSSSFLGIADAAISNAASGKITMKGGVATNSQLLPLAYTGSVGSEVVFEAGRADHSEPIFDSSNNKVVIVYADDDDSAHGKAIVGTVSGTYGTAVTFNTATTTRISGTFDSNSNKIVVNYVDSDGNKLKSRVGTVSGTSISFGTEVIVSGLVTTAATTSTIFDSNSNKVVLFYRDDSNSDYGTAAVGTVSGTDISYGTPVVFESANIELFQHSATFDTSNNKTVVVYRDIGNLSYGTAIVGTVSGTSISFGTANTYNSFTTEDAVCTFDSTNNKVVVVYRNNINPKDINSRVGTVSLELHITFGSATSSGY